jgi:hypothetical protein
MIDNDPGLTACNDMTNRALVEKLNKITEAGAAMELPRYKCNKEVWALKIEAVKDPTEPGNETDGSRILIFAEKPYAPLRVDHDYVRRHKPEAGGYYVVYSDGYKSFSPAKGFEDGYTRA